MKHHPLHPHSPFRIFAVSALATIISIVGMLIGKGVEAMMVTIVLIAIEVSFSFDNAILNSKVLSKMSPFWQTMFLTVGALIAIFGMRFIFPILIVAITADISWGQVIDLAWNHPEQYSLKLEEAHPAIAAFGGAFLLVLALDFFTDSEHEVLWLTRVERNMAKLARNWAPPLIALGVVLFVGLLPFNHHAGETIPAGILGIAIYSALHGLIEYMGRLQKKRALASAAKQTGMVAFLSFMYLEVLDASFSFDGVIGAFVVTQDVLIIAIGLGVGALWVRSLTIFLVF